MKKVIAFIQAALLAAGMLALASCDSEDESTYDVSIEWLIYGGPGCSSPVMDWLPEELLDPSLEDKYDPNNKLVVDQIIIRVFDGEDDSTPPIRETTKDCVSGENSYVISALERGTYYVTIEGMATYDEVTLPYFKGAMEIIAPPSEDVVEVDLENVGGSATVKWNFPDATFCNANGVEKVNVVITGELEGAVYTAENVPCDDGVVVREDVDWDIYHVDIEGYDASNTLTHTGSSAESFKVRPGEEAETVVTLEAN